MEYYEFDKKVDDDIEDFPSLSSDILTPLNGGLNLTLDGAVDSEWLDNFLDDPVLNDCMMSDALQPVHVQSEHSYSLTNEDGQQQNSLQSKDTEFDNELLPAVDPKATTMKSENVAKPQSLLIKTEKGHIENTYDIKQHSVDTKSNVTAFKDDAMCFQTALRQPTIILAAQPHIDSSTIKQDTSVFSNVNIKVEPVDCSPPLSPDNQDSYDSIRLPPTPPSSNSSDSEGGLSPHRASPKSPLRHQSLTRQQAIRSVSQSQQLFSSPIPTSGVLILSEEEKRTLISEGYPIPNKLPLTKQEEKNLKKIRRKIKNKISAQESRRKKKEYLETLEKKVESFNTENMDLRRKVDQLENNNRSLMAQLQKLQSLAGKLTSGTPSTQTGTCLMVLVVFFAVFLGGWSPVLPRFGYSSSLPASIMQTHKLSNQLNSDQIIGPQMQDVNTVGGADAYQTPNMRSRVLLSIKEEDGDYGPHPPVDYKSIMASWFSSTKSSCYKAISELVMMPPSPEVEVSNSVKIIEDTEPSGLPTVLSSASNATGTVTASGSPMGNATA